jgi:hypothetical protein
MNAVNLQVKEATRLMSSASLRGRSPDPATMRSAERTLLRVSVTQTHRAKLAHTEDSHNS